MPTLKNGHCCLFVLATVQPKDLWIGDRNFCTRSFLVGIAYKKAGFVIRQHQGMPWTAQTELSHVGQSDTGKVEEQQVLIDHEGKYLLVRRVVVRLNQPTRDGETEVAVFALFVSLSCRCFADSSAVSQALDSRRLISSHY